MGEKKILEIIAEYFPEVIKASASKNRVSPKQGDSETAEHRCQREALNRLNENRDELDMVSALMRLIT